MKNSRVLCLLFACLLVIIVALMLGSRDHGKAQSASGAPTPATIAQDLPVEAAPAVEPLSRAGLEPAEPAPVASPLPVSEIRVKRTISEEWLDAPDKLAGRQRVRIVEADFKYPRLRLEESVTVDPVTGVETVTLLRASVADHLLLGLKPGTDSLLAQTALRDRGYVVRAVEPESHILAEIPLFDTAADHARAAADLAVLDEFIEHAEPDYLVFPCQTPNDPAYAQGKMWGLHNPGTSAESTPDSDIDAPEGWAIRHDAPTVVVAVTDTGIQYNHEDLVDNMWTHPTDGSHGLDAYDNDSDPMDTSGHGTHCAGTIGARGDNSKGLTGVAWDVKLMAVRFLGPDGGTTSDAIRSVNYSRQNGANIISASWGGGGFSKSLYNAIKACADAGIPIVASAGNTSLNNDASPHYPASFDLENIVAVAATTKNDSLSAFSCYGRVSVDLGAPGSSIWSTSVGSNTSYSYLNGTSMATPHVSGALALAMAHFPGETMQTLIARLYASTDKIPALAGKTSTGGRLNLARLLGDSPPGTLNDNFADAHRFEGDYGTWIGTNAGATHQPGESTFSVPGIGNKSLWFAFRTPHAGLISLDATSDLALFEMVLFEGDQTGSLKVVAKTTNRTRNIRFDSKPDTEYRLVIDTYAASTQRFSLNYQLAPPNDFFAAATPLFGNAFTATGYNRAATNEVFEKGKPHAGSGQGKSVWWRWTAPENGDFTINTSGSDFDTVLAIYTGTNPKKLTKVASNDDRSPLDWTSQVTISAVAGTIYHIAVDSFREDSAGNIVLNGFRSGTLEIIRQPASLIVELGKRAVFDVSVMSGGEVTYQWFHNAVAIPGQTSADLVIDPVRAADFGNYRVEVRNTESIAVSDTAVLSELQVAPKLVWSSGNQAVATATPVTLAANFSGSTPLTFAWTKNGQPVSAAAAPSLAFPSATPADAGAYRLTATNSAGSATADFSLTVVESPWERWEWRRPGIPNAAITDIKVYGNEAFAVAATILFRSTDGTRWTKSVFPQGFTANSIAKSGNLFVCLGANQDNALRIATSTDNAATWTVATPTGFTVLSQPEKSSLIAHGSAFIAYSASGQDFLRSTNGTAWTRLTATNITGQTVNLMGNGHIATNGSTLILASMSSSSNSGELYLKSTDGITWTERATQAVGYFSPLTAHYALGKFHLFDAYSIQTSTDGENWQYHSAPSNSFAKNSLFASNGESLIAFLSGSQSLAYYSDPGDRKSRTLQPANSHSFTAAATFGTKVLYGTDKGLLGLAADPLDVRIPQEKSSTLQSIEFTENLFIARTTNSASYAVSDLVSGDGATWKPSTRLDAPNATYTGSASGKYYGKGSFQTAIHSGHNPFDVRLSPGDNIGLAPNINFIGQLPNGSALAVSSPATGSSTLHTRATGATTWSPVTFPLAITAASKFASLGDRWFSNIGSATSASALIHTSTTGTTWTSTGLTGSNPHFATFAGKSWCLYQTATYPYPTYAASSTNGTSWTAAATTGIPTNNTKFARRVVAFGTYLILLGADENLYFSENGTTWLRSFTPGKIVDIATGNGQLVAVMKNGGIIQTGSIHPGVSAPRVTIVSPQTAGTHLVGSRVTIEGTISDPEDGVASYECFLDAALVASGTGTAFRFHVTTSDLNGHTITVRASDSHGLRQIDAIRLKVVAPESQNLLTSLEGVAYVPQSHATTFDGVFYTASSRAVYRSFDGKSWQRVPIPSFANTIYGMASGNGSLVIQFDNGAIITTRDGINWTHFQPNLTDYWVREPIRFASGVFIAAYQTQGTTTGSVMTSPDGLRWETGAVSVEGYLSWSANSGDGTIIGANAYQGGVHRTVDNGFNWLPVAPLATASQYNSHGIFAAGKFVVALTGLNKLLISANAVNWTEQALPAGITQQPILGHLGGLFFLGKSPDFSQVSGDGSSWQPMSRSVQRQKITHARGLFVAQATSGGIVTSRDGIQWTSVTIPGMPATVSKIISNDNAYLVIDSIGGVWSSPDGKAWVALLPGSTVTFPPSGRIGRSIAELSGKIVVAGGGILVTSADDGRTWANATLNGQPPSTSVTYHKVVSSASELLLLEGPTQNPTILRRSTDGTTFTTVSGLPAKTWVDLARNSAEWMLLANDGTLFRSTDGGLTWAQIPVTGIARGAALAWFNARWVIIGADTSSTSSPYTAYTLNPGDIFLKHTAIGFYNSYSQVRTLVAHGKMVIWQRGETAFVSADGIAWTASNLNAGAGNNDFDIHHTADGFTAFIPSSVAYYPVRTWRANLNGLTWQEVPSEFNNIWFSENLGERIFLFSSNSIAELHDKDLALTLPALPAATLGVGDEVAATVTISNFGRAVPTTGSWKVTAWLAKNRFFGDTKSVFLGTCELAGAMPAPGTSATYGVSFTLPNEILTGDNYLILSLSSPHGVVETNTANNTVISATAAIQIPEWEFSVATNGNGAVNRDFAASRYPHKAQVSLTASAGKGAVFTGWAGDAYSPNNQITLLMDGDKSVQANFSNRATLQVFVSGMGQVNGLTDLGSYPVGGNAQITAESAPGWEFSHWSGDSAATLPATTILMDTPKAVTAHFVLPMATWKSARFTSEQLANPAISGDDEDPDKDGVATWREYLHGSHPMDSTSTGVSAITIEGGFLCYGYTRNLGAAGGALLTCQAGRDLSDWDAPDLEERILSTLDGVETVEARIPVASHTRGYIRFRYDPPQP